MALSSSSGAESVIAKERARMANILTVRVSEQVSLEAGTWEERVDQHQKPYRLITPPGNTMYEQLLAYLIDTTKDQKTRPQPTFDFEEVAIATVAVCIQWGSYFAVLNNSELPLWSASKTASCIADSEMARLNIEMSAALTHWISLIESDNKLFRTLVKAALQLLPFPNVTIDPRTRLDRNMLYADGAIRLTNPLASGQADSYTVLEKRALVQDRAKGLV